MKKRCPTCKWTFTWSERSDHPLFYRSKGRYDGWDWQCKLCKKKSQNISRRRFRDLRSKYKNRHKVKARMKAYEKYKDQYEWWQCSVVTCEVQCEELHHFDYTKPFDVIPLCGKHHRDLHA